MADDDPTDPHAQPALQRLRAVSQQHAALLADPQAARRAGRIATASDFAIDVLLRQPGLLAQLLADDGAQACPPPALLSDRRGEWPLLLRRYRRAESARLVWRDVLGLDAVEDTLAGSTRLAERCLHLALGALEDEFAQRYGQVRAANGDAQRLVVFGLGKLGGGELNFSSDIDLVYAYEQAGESDGARALAAEDYFARLGQQLARLLDEVTAEGFSHRVDLRLRPFGNAGRVALSFAAMEQYFQREGRDWERYAWQKARPVAGDLAAGERFLATLRPFVYRRYLDYGALDGLREMKAAIAAEVARKELADDIKRGPGGIREIEFLAQALQLIRGGREPALRERRLLPALCALRDANHLSADATDALIEAYRFLRRLENRLQMLRDAQTHALPVDAFDRTRIAQGLGHADWPGLSRELDAHRARVAAEFDALLTPRRRQTGSVDLAAYWRALPEAGDADALAATGFAEAAEADAALRDFSRTPGVRDLSDAARARLDRLMPALLAATAASTQPLLALRRLLALLHSILRRTSYLALLDEQPAALARLVDVVARSALLAERLAAHPLLLDELLDARILRQGQDERASAVQRAQCRAACVAALHSDDVEASLLALNEARQALSFRIAMATLDARQPAADSALQLAWLADAVLASVLTLAQRDMRAAHGDIAHGGKGGARFAVLGYGSLGGEELGFGSDLDLVFLYDAADAGQSDGARPLDAARWFARLAQKVVALLGAPTGAGRLYEVDVRLRPDGAKGLLVSSLSSFADYQRERAWTWEHQALVRARCVAGDPGLCTEFEHVRAQTLAHTRDADALRADVVAMRAKMRAELDRSQPDRPEPDRSELVRSGPGRSDAARFDLKQGEGGLVDLEFLLQFLVLRDAAQHRALLAPRDTRGLIDAAGAAGAFDPVTATRLREAHATLVALGLECTLDRRRRLVGDSDALMAARATIRAATRANGLAF